MPLVRPGYLPSRSFSTSRTVVPSPSTTGSPPERARIIVGIFIFTAIVTSRPRRARGVVGPGWEAAEQLVVDQLGDRRLLAAHRAVGIPPKLDRRELHVERVEQEQPPDQRLALAD